MTDKIDTLREVAIQYGGTIGTSGVIRQQLNLVYVAELELRDEFERLREERDNAIGSDYEILRAALLDIASGCDHCNSEDAQKMSAKARAALNPKWR